MPPPPHIESLTVPPPPPPIPKLLRGPCPSACFMYKRERQVTNELQIYTQLKKTTFLLVRTYIHLLAHYYTCKHSFTRTTAVCFPAFASPQIATLHPPPHSQPCMHLRPCTPDPILAILHS